MGGLRRQRGRADGKEVRVQWQTLRARVCVPGALHGLLRIRVHFQSSGPRARARAATSNRSHSHPGPRRMHTCRMRAWRVVIRVLVRGKAQEDLGLGLGFG